MRYNPEVQDDEPRIQWAKIKSVDRAVEKAVRVYYEASLATCWLFHRPASRSLSDGLIHHLSQRFFFFFQFASGLLLAALFLYFL